MRAPAKVNLTLGVRGRRPDGYHELETLMLAVDLCDRVTLRPRSAPGVNAHVGGPFASADIPTDGKNLAVRAAELALAHARQLGSDALGLELELEKHIPSQAGLGGASSDAAATLLACERALGVSLGQDWMRATLAELGSDCVFFLDARASGVGRCEGRGERVTSLSKPEHAWWLTVITPTLTSSTADVYDTFAKHLSQARPAHTVRPTLLALPAAEARACLYNDLEESAIEAVAGLRNWRDALRACGADYHRLAGSGSSWYGLHADEREARRSLEQITAAARARELGLRGSWVLRPWTT